MMQLSLIGPPEEPAAPQGRDRLRRRVHAALATSLSAHVDARALHDAVDSVVRELTAKHPPIDTRTLVLRLCDYRPVCWICGFSIALTEPENTPGSFTLDHVVPRSEGGGGLGVGNLKPAHRFCNILRSEKRARRRTRSRYEAFLSVLEATALASDDG